MKPDLSRLFTLYSQVSQTKPKPNARGEGIRTVRKWKAMQEHLLECAITAELAAEIEAEWQVAIEAEPMCGDVTFLKDMGLA